MHFYNQSEFGVLIYALAQTAVVNYRDLVVAVFSRPLDKELGLSLLPLGLAPPVDPIAFLRNASGDSKLSPMVCNFTQRFREFDTELDVDGADTSRLMTVFTVKLESTKKLVAADLVLGVSGDSTETDKLLVHRRLDPNKTHPYRESDIVTSKKKSDKGMGLVVGGRQLGQFEFRAIVHHLSVKQEERWCWMDGSGAVTRYSAELVSILKKLSAAEVEAAITSYRASTKAPKKGRA